MIRSATKFFDLFTGEVVEVASRDRIQVLVRNISTGRQFSVARGDFARRWRELPLAEIAA